MWTIHSGSFVALTLAALAPVAASAQDAALPTVDQVLSKYVAAVGGKEAIAKVNTRVAKGTIEIVTFGASGTFEQYTKSSPNRTVTRSTFEGFGAVIQCYDGKTGWMSDPQQGFRELAGQELASFKRSADLQSILHSKEYYKTLTLTGKGRVGDHDAYVVEGQPPEGAPEKLYFDAQTGLLARFEMPSPQGTGTVTIGFEDYQAFDGVQIATTIRQETPEISLVIKMKEIHQNVPVDDAKFAKPAPQTAPTPAPAIP
jgi:outer membrane lipoprotein-sorting protein